PNISTSVQESRFIIFCYKLCLSYYPTQRNIDLLSIILSKLGKCFICYCSWLYMISIRATDCSKKM
ncbi:hypothetical protein L9F63_008247, partial [Diploptera punctata]